MNILSSQISEISLISCTYHSQLIQMDIQLNI